MKIERLKTSEALPKRFIDARYEQRTANSICSDHDDDCYSLNNAPLKCWLKAPECGICPLLATDKGEYCG